MLAATVYSKCRRERERPCPSCRSSSRICRYESSYRRGHSSHQFYPNKRKLIYCSRTVPEIEKALAELKRLMEYRESMGAKDEGFRGLGLTSRRNLCLHPEVSKEKKGKVADSRCRDLTSSFACEKGRADPGSVPLCSFHEELNNYEQGELLPTGVMTLDDVKRYGQEKGVCPYFAIRRMVRRRGHGPGVADRAVAISRRGHLFLPLSARSQSRRTGFG